jgi:hypothetical protein
MYVLPFWGLREVCFAPNFPPQAIFFTPRWMPSLTEPVSQHPKNYLKGTVARDCFAMSWPNIKMCFSLFTELVKFTRGSVVSLAGCWFSIFLSFWYILKNVFSRVLVLFDRNTWESAQPSEMTTTLSKTKHVSLTWTLNWVSSGWGRWLAVSFNISANGKHESTLILKTWVPGGANSRNKPK